MFEQAQKQAVIVYRKKEDEYAHLLANLISAFTEYEVAEWDEKVWLANKATTSSSQKVIFIGDSKEAHKRHHGMSWAYNQLNMKFGWLGNQCIVDTDPLSVDDFKGFCEYYQQKATEHEGISGKPILRLPGDVLTETKNESGDSVEVVRDAPLELEDSVDDSEASLILPDDKPIERIRTIFSKPSKMTKPDLVKLGSDAIAPINNQIIKGKLTRFQYNLIIREFVFNGGLRDFMES